jgi:ATP-dependent DNA helicase RecG
MQKIKEILLQAEGRRLEFKEKMPSKSELYKTIIAFANDAGGMLFIGIEENGEDEE